MIELFKKYSILLNNHQKGRLIILFFMMLVGAFLEVLGVSMMLPVISALMDKRIIENNALAAKVAGFFGIHSSISFMLLCIATLIIVYIVKDLYIIFETYVQCRFTYSNRLKLQSDILRVYMAKPYEFFLSTSSGETLRIIQQDVVNVYALMSQILSFFTESIVSLALLIAVFIINPLMTILVFVVMLISIYIITKAVRPKMTKWGIIYQDTTAITNKWLLQMVTGIKEIKIAHTQEYFQKNFDRHAEDNVNAVKTQAVWGTTPRLMIEMTAICSALVAVAVQIINGNDFNSLLTALSAFVMAASRLLPAGNRVVSALSQIEYYRPSVDKVIGMLRSINRNDNHCYSLIKEKVNINKSMTTRETIELSHISYTYPTGEKEILSDATMIIPIGKSVGIVGESGSGKTTTVDILLGLLHPSTGQVLSDGIDVKEHYEEWLSQIGYIPQMIFMLDGTVRENVVFGSNVSPGDNDENVWRALREAQLEDVIKGLPEGLNTEIGERGIRLSGGQRQRLGIARALFSNPSILVFDEATSSLDNNTEAAIMESINSLHGKKTLIIIAHRLSTIKECDLIYRVEDGKINLTKKAF